MREMKSSIFKRTPQDDIDDLKYFWSKVRVLRTSLTNQGYTITLVEDRADVLHPHQPTDNRQQSKARSKRAAREVSER